MKTIFLVTTGSYSDYSVESAWSTREAAEKQRAVLSTPDSDEVRIEEFYLDAPTPDERLLFLVRWDARHKDVKIFVDRYAPVGRVPSNEHAFSCVHDGPAKGAVFGRYFTFADDEEHAVKIASENRAEWIAKQGVTRR